MLTNLLLFATGYLIATTVWYLNHRFVFHGKLGKLPLLKRFARLHRLHHQNAYNHRRNKFIMIPWWGHILLFLASMPLLIVGPACWAGAFCFSLVYGWRHHRIHNTDDANIHYIYHAVHHLVDPNANFSGVHPWVDRAFKTDYLSRHPIRVKRRK